MYRASVKADDDIVEANIEAVDNAFPIMKTLTKRRFSKTKSKGLARLRAEPALWPENKPRRWKSRRQQIYVIMLLKEEDNLPYQRTHNLVNAWELNLTLDDNGATITAENDDPSVQFVQGDWTQPMHLDSEWPQAAPILTDLQEELNDGMIEDWFTATDPRAGVSS